MDYSEINCPQYVAFDSEDFHRGLLDNSDDSLNMPNCTDSVVSSESSYLDQSHDFPVNIVAQSKNDSSQSSGFDNEASKENISHVDIQPLKKQRRDKPTSKTVPVPFNFKTDNRIQNTTVTTYKEKDFIAQLRKTENVKNKTSKLTKVQPFHLHESSKRKHDEAEYVSMAERMAAFQKTPARFRSVPNGKNFQPQDHWEPPKLCPVTPELQAVKRRRVVTAVSRAEQEEKEAEEMKSYTFHANSLDPKIYPASYKTTAMILRSDKKKPRQKQAEQYKFRARPVPKSILAGPTGLGEKPEVKTTVPQPPVFETTDRLEKRKLRERPVSVPVQKQPPKQPGPPPCSPLKHKLTLVQPFSFDHHDQERLKRKEEKIKEEQKKKSEIPDFHALPLPDLKQPSLPDVPVKPITEPQPFNFESDSRVTKHGNHEKQEIFIFKAQPAKVLNQEPFVPAKSQKHPTEPEEFSHHSRTRASARHQLRLIKEAEEAEREQARLIRQKQEEIQEQAELQRLRQELVHKAQPIRHYPPVEIKPSEVPLTTPQSPNFATHKLRSMRN